MTTQVLLWVRSMPKSDKLDGSAVLVRRELAENVYAFSIGILLKTEDAYTIFLTRGEEDIFLSPEEVEWTLL